MKHLGFLLLSISMTAAAVAYCHGAFAPKSIQRSVEQTRAVVCMIAIKTLTKEESSLHCGDIIKNK